MSATSEQAGQDGAESRGDRGLLETVPAAERLRPIPRRSFFGLLPPLDCPEPLPSSMAVVEAPAEDRLGICCSGGGIRSAAFNLGALQALQEHKELSRAKYLAAVSGGSYIAAAFCMVAKTPDDPDDQDDSVRSLFDPDPKGGPAAPTRPPFHRNSPEEQYLRNRSSYMAPDGLGKVFLAFRVFMGLAFNLFFLGLPVLAAGLVLGEVVYGLGYDNLLGACAESSADCAIADVPALAWWVLLAAVVVVAAVGVAVLLVRFHSDRRRKAFELLAPRLLVVLGGLGLVLVGVPVLIAWLFGAPGSPSVGATADAPGVPAAGAGGLVALLVGALSLAHERVKGAVSSEAAGTRLGAVRRLGGKARLAVAYVVGALVGPALFVLIAAYGAAVALANPGWWELLPVAAGAVALFAGLYAVADLNTWSLHPFYRRRLCTAFALKRVGTSDAPRAEERNFERLVPLSCSGVKPGPGNTDWPTLIVCAAANVSDPAATPPGRGVTSFTFSPTAIGGPLIGAASTAAYEEALGSNRRRDITLPAAVAMSGAALAPSMGKLTRKPFTFLLALANLRLGVWVPNPRCLHTWNRREPGRLHRWLRERVNRFRRKRDMPELEVRDVYRMPRPSYLLRELMGSNRVDDEFLYVSDGGHYENLGLVELLRRGCMEVYCFDASGGTSAKELGDAIALARSELGVEIRFATGPEALEEVGTPPVAARCCIVGTIHYPGVEDEGRLVYARTVMTADLPWDVRAFRDADPDFPHHSTIDQLYTDQKFEAYRALGYEAGRTATVAMHPGPWARSKPREKAAPVTGPAGATVVKAAPVTGATGVEEGPAAIPA